MIYIIYIQRFTSVHLIQIFDLIYINLYNLYLYLLIHLLYVLYSAWIRHAGIRKTVLSLLLLVVIGYGKGKVSSYIAQYPWQACSIKYRLSFSGKHPAICCN